MERARQNPVTVGTLLRLPLLTAFACLIALGCLACGGGEDSVPTEARPSPIASATTPSGQPTPGQGASPSPAPAKSPPPVSTSPASNGTPVPPPAAPSPTPDRTPPTGATTASAGEVASDALAQWLGPVGDRSAIAVIAEEIVTWPDGCLGLQRPGVFCTQALVEGFRVRLALGDAEYEVRMDAAPSVVAWSPSVQVMARFSEASANFIQFVTDDGGLLPVQPVAGTSFGVDVADLESGDPVAVALAERPQGDGFLLVWLDPISP